jgi:hypothetical protein
VPKRIVFAPQVVLLRGGFDLVAVRRLLVELADEVGSV